MVLCYMMVHFPLDVQTLYWGFGISGSPMVTNLLDWLLSLFILYSSTGLGVCKQNPTQFIWLLFVLYSSVVLVVNKTLLNSVESEIVFLNLKP